MTSSPLFEPLTLPNGSTLPNRICKAAMEENLAVQPGQLPGEKLFTLYERWARGGVGLILSGNVMVDPSALTGPGGVVLQKGTDLTLFKNWAQIGKSGGGQFWLQISHPGRQMYKSLGETAVSPSDVALDLGKFSDLFAPVRALGVDEIEAIIARFADTAEQAEEAGFDGVQIHGAHGYLVSQFLSPLTNKRTDEWGGSLENRARFLLRIADAIRAQVKPGFGVGVKLNSADFQRGGFEFEDARQVVEWLNGKGIDFVELSGGSYESPAMQGNPQDDDDTAPKTSTEKREAYFVEFARDIAKVADMPIMVTGGVTKLATAEAALAQDEHGFGVELLGIARAIAADPFLPRHWQAGSNTEVELPKVSWNGPLAGLAVMALCKAQIERMAKGKSPGNGGLPAVALAADQYRATRRAKRYRKWRASTA